MIVILILNNL